MQLRGVPRLNGIERPRASIETPVSDEWQEVTRTIEIGQVRRIERLGTRRWRGRWSVGYAALTRGEALALRSDLEADTLLWCPRTRLAGDPAFIEETEIEVYLNSPISSLNPLWRRNDRTGEEWWEMKFELISAETVTTKPNVFVGGFYVAAEDTESVTLEAWGDATITDAPETIDVQLIDADGVLQSYSLEAVTLGTPAILAMRTLDDTTDTLTLATSPSPNPIEES